MSKILPVLLLAVMLLHLIRPIGLPGLRRRADFWKIAVGAIALMMLTRAGHIVVVAETGEALVITKHGRPVARLEPPLRPADLRGSVEFRISDDELINFSMGPWDMERDE